MFLRYMVRYWPVAALCLALTHASALTLSEAVVLARRSDPTFLGAQANLDAARGRSSQAFSSLLPQVSVTSNTTLNRRNYAVREADFPPTSDRYNGNNAQLSLNQALWRSAQRIAVKQADVVVEQTDFQLAAAEQDLLVRLAQAWFDVMQTRDAVVASRMQVVAMQYQWKQNSYAVQVGLAAGPASDEARMKYDQAVADHAAADTEYRIKIAALEQIIGPVVSLNTPSLSEKFETADPRIETLESWIARAEAESPAVLAASRAFDAANEEVRKQRAGHEPTLDVVASYGRNAQAVGSFPGQDGYSIKQGAVGLQLNIPIYSGGGQNAKVREAIAMREKAAQELEQARRNVRFAGKQAWFAWQAGLARQAAGLQGVKFSSLALKVATAGKENGLRAQMDVLQAGYQLYAARRDLQRARYEMITSYLKLKAAAGTLSVEDLIGFDKWFEPDTQRDAEEFLAQFNDAELIR